MRLGILLCWGLVLNNGLGRGYFPAEPRITSKSSLCLGRMEGAQRKGWERVSSRPTAGALGGSCCRPRKTLPLRPGKNPSAPARIQTVRAGTCIANLSTKSGLWVDAQPKTDGLSTKTGLWVDAQPKTDGLSTRTGLWVDAPPKTDGLST